MAAYKKLSQINCDSQSDNEGSNLLGGESNQEEVNPPPKPPVKKVLRGRAAAALIAASSDDDDDDDKTNNKAGIYSMKLNNVKKDIKTIEKNFQSVESKSWF